MTSVSLGGGRVPTTRAKVRRHDADNQIGGRATLAVEEPLEIRVDGQVLATTMRTPGHDFDLALGFAITDGGVEPVQVAGMSYCGADAGEVSASSAAADLTGPFAGEFNVINVATRDGSGPPVVRTRTGAVSTACGICGSDAVHDLLERAGSVDDVHLDLSSTVVQGIAQTVRAAQAGFDATGALHAAAALDARGRLQSVHEDVGRHNAVDKVIGDLATQGALPADNAILFTSGRVAFEIVAKALIAGFPMIVAVSAPTSLAVQTSVAAGLTLIGFARGETFTVYSRPDRIRD